MTRSIVEAWGLLVKWPSKNDAPRWPRREDRRIMRPTGRGEYGNSRVQEIVSGTPGPSRAFSAFKDLGATLNLTLALGMGSH